MGWNVKIAAYAWVPVLQCFSKPPSKPAVPGLALAVLLRAGRRGCNAFHQPVACGSASAPTAPLPPDAASLQRAPETLTKLPPQAFQAFLSFFLVCAEGCRACSSFHGMEFPCPEGDGSDDDSLDFGSDNTEEEGSVSAASVPTPAPVDIAAPVLGGDCASTGKLSISSLELWVGGLGLKDGLSNDQVVINDPVISAADSILMVPLDLFCAPSWLVHHNCGWLLRLEVRSWWSCCSKYPSWPATEATMPPALLAGPANRW